MIKPLEVHFHGVPKVAVLEKHIGELVGKLEHQHPELASCQVHLERPHRHRHTHNGWNVLVEIHFGHTEIAVRKSSDGQDPHDNGYKVLDEAFEAVARQMRRVSDKMRGYVKHHEAPVAEEVVEDEEAEEEVPA